MVHAPASHKQEEHEFYMQHVQVVIKKRTEYHLWCTVYAPRKAAMQREAHTPGIEPIGEFSIMNALTDEIIDGVFNSNNIILQRSEHETDRGESQYAGQCDKKIWPYPGDKTGL